MSSHYDTLFGLSGKLWPIHLQPQEDELLSSWIIRLAHAHGYKVQTMTSMLFGKNSAIWNRDIDQLAPFEDLEVLSSITGVTLEQIERTTLRSLEGSLFERHRPNGMCRWIIPIGIFHRLRRRPGLMFCPQCLKEDVNPFFRKIWRLAFVTTCTKHGCYLLDRCPNCSSPLAPHRSDMHSRTIFPVPGLNVCCWKCGFDYRNDIEQSNLPNEPVLRFQSKLEDALKNGFIEWAGNQSMHSITYFEGLRALIAGITSKHTLERLNKSKKIDTISLNGWTKSGLEIAELLKRRELFVILTEILDRWPGNFVELIQECKLRYADLKGYSEQRSYWYEEVIHCEAGTRQISTSKEEFDSISNAVFARYGKFTPFKAKALFDRKLHWQSVKSISDETYEALLISIDHQISGTLDHKSRAALIRDKIMFATGRILRLTQSDLASLTLDQVRRLVSKKETADFYNIADTPEQARAWVEWYYENTRSELEPNKDVEYVFTSAVTKRGLRRSIIGLRFRSAVNFAKLNREIDEYGAWIK